MTAQTSLEQKKKTKKKTTSLLTQVKELLEYYIESQTCNFQQYNQTRQQRWTGLLAGKVYGISIDETVPQASI